MKALLIIDMQKGSFPSYSAIYDTLNIVSRINMLSDMFRAKNYPVIFIQHDGSVEGEFIPHTNAWQLIPEMTKSSSDLYINKTANDSFYKSTLQQVLIDHDIDELYITGSATDFCVDATVKSALSKDYKLTVIADCHTTEDKPNLPASILIGHYNSVWSFLTPTKHRILVKNADYIEI